MKQSEEEEEMSVQTDMDTSVGEKSPAALSA